MKSLSLNSALLRWLNTRLSFLRKIAGKQLHLDVPAAATSSDESRSYRKEIAASNLGAVTHSGPNRSANEDDFAFGCENRVIIVADGLGGHAGGSVASRIGCEAAVASMQRTLSSGANEDDKQEASDRVSQALSDAHLAIVEHAAQHPELKGMGCTMVLAWIANPDIHIAHVGDARAYHLADQNLQCLTKDHSFVARLVELGEITSEEAETNPNKNVILQAVGAAETLRPSVTSIEMRQGERLLLCSDGLWDALPFDQIARLLGGSLDVAGTVSSLIDAAIEANASDNITAAVFECDKVDGTKLQKK